MAHQDWIYIRDLRVECVVGIYPHERDTAQPLSVDLGLCLDTEAAALKESVRASVDYAVISAQVEFLLTSCRFRMLETAAHVLSRFLLAPPAPGEGRAPLQGVRIRMEKPGGLPGDAVPSLEIERSAAGLAFEHEQKGFGTVDIIHETRDAGIYRLNVMPGRGIPLHVHRRMQESEMVLSEGLHCQGRPVTRGTVHRWPLDAPHCYDNPSDRVQTILCVDAPAFMEADEIPVSGEPAQVQPEP